MGSKKIIVPQGLINPNETTIIEIPNGVDSEATLIARSSPSENHNNTSCGNSKCNSRSKGKSKTVDLNKSSGATPRLITKVTSTTVFETNDEGEEVMASRSNREEYSTSGRNMYRPGLTNVYQDQTRTLTPNNSSRYQENYHQQQTYDYEPYQQPRSTNQCVPNKSVCNDSSCPVVSSIMETRNSRQMASAYASPAPSYTYPNHQTPRQRVKIVRKVITDTPSYSAAPGGASQFSRFNPAFNSTQNQNEVAEDPSRTCTTCGSSGSNGQSQNLRLQVEKHLAEIEESERQKINRDLAIFQQARRRLVEDATNISSGESNIQFKK